MSIRGGRSKIRRNIFFAVLNIGMAFFSVSDVYATDYTINCDATTTITEGTYTSDDNLTLADGGAGICEMDNILSINTLTIQAGVTLTHPAQNTTGINITATTIDINAGGIIDLNGKGCAGGAVATNGTAQTSSAGACTATIGGFGDGSATLWGAGGGHGGEGGRSGDSVSAVGAINDSPLQPVLLGSGGGGGQGSAGGNGGGKIQLDVTGTLTVNGAITANGSNGSVPASNEAGGGGSGGAIYIKTDTLSGGSNITAHGGNGGNAVSGVNDASGGGGGAVAVYYNTLSSFTITNTSIAANKGSEGTGGTTSATDGTPGGTFILDDKVDTGGGNLRITSGMNFENSDFSRDTVTVDANAVLGCRSTTTITLASTTTMTFGSGVTWDCSASVTNWNITAGSTLSMTSNTFQSNIVNNWNLSAATWSQSGTNVITYNKGGGTFDWNISNDLTLTNLTYSGPASTSTTPNVINFDNAINVSLVNTDIIGHINWTNLASLNIDSNSSINVSGAGCQQGLSSNNGMGVNTSTGACALSQTGFGDTIASNATGYAGGAGHGGAGGSSSDGVAGATYDTNTAPVFVGAGGGANSSAGGIGGGKVRIGVTGTLTVNGIITANGSNGTNSTTRAGGGGAGGSIYITCAILAKDITGIGTISANGGNGGDSTTTTTADGSGGGGGRIAIYYGSTSGFDLGTPTVNKGVKVADTTNGSSDGGNGTLYTFQYGVPTTPSITAPTNGATDVDLNPTLTSSAYSSDALIHTSSSWKITSDVLGDTVVWSAINSTSHLTSIVADDTQGSFEDELTELNGDTTYYVFVRHSNGAGDSSWSAVSQFTTLGSVRPVSSGVSIQSGAGSINLTENTTTEITVTGTVSDEDGCSDIASAQVLFYRTTVGAGASDDSNNHYTASCSQDVGSCTGGADTIAMYSCSLNIDYYADPTDAASIYASDHWTAQLTGTDGVGSGTADSDTIEMNTLTALNVTASIHFGALALGSNTGATNQTTVITNTGNEGIDSNLYGYATTPGDGNAMSCSIGSIPIANQKYHTASFTYDSGGTALSSSTTAINVNIPQRTNASTTSTLYWGLSLPSTGIGGACSGSVVMTPISDPNLL